MTPKHRNRQKNHSEKGNNKSRKQETSLSINDDDCNILGFRIIEKSPIKVIDLPIDPPKHNNIDNIKSKVFTLYQSVMESNIKIKNEDIRLVRLISKSKNVSGLTCDFIENDIAEIVNEIGGLKDAYEIGRYWIELKEKITKLKIILSPFFKNETYIEELLNNTFKRNETSLINVIQNVINEYNNLRDFEDVSPLLDAINFINSNKVISDHFIPRFIDSVATYVQPIIDVGFEKDFNIYLNESKALEESEIRLATIFGSKNLICLLRKRLEKIIFSEKIQEIFKSNLRSAIKQRNNDCINTCSKLARNTGIFNCFLHEVSILFEEEAIQCFKEKHPIHQLVKLYLTLSSLCNVSFGPKSSRTIKTSFARGLNSEPESSTRFLAFAINKSFSKSNPNIETLDIYFQLFKMLTLNDVFETYYTKLLTKRILYLKKFDFESEYYMIKKFEEECNSDYTKRMELLFEDLNCSNKVNKLFKSNDKSIKFSAIILSQESCDYIKTSCFHPPKNILKIYNQYSNVYSKNYKQRKISWINQLSKSTIKVSNIPGIQKIHCSGDFASILMQFNNNSSIEKSKLSKLLSTKEEEIEKKLSPLSTKNFGKFILINDKKYTINTKSTVDGGTLNFPTSFQITETDEIKIAKTISQNNDYQLDAAIIAIAKSNKSIDKEVMFNSLKDIVNFRLDNEYFQKRLQALCKKEYIKLELSGKVHYIP